MAVESVGTIYAEYGLDYTKFQQGVRAVQQETRQLDQMTQQAVTSMSKQWEQLGKTMSVGVTVPLTLMGRTALQTFSAFQQSMANTASVANATTAELQALTEAARKGGAETVFSASQAADALYYMASGGLTAQQAIAALNGTLALAAATQSDLAFTSSNVIAALAQFGLQASESTRIANVYAAAISNSMATMDKLANSMRYVGPVAAGFNMSIEETTALLMAMYNAGLEGETAGAALRMALTSLAAPTDAAAELIRSLGLSLDDVNPALHSMAEIMDRLARSGITTAQTMELFGSRAGTGMVALLGQGADAVRDFEQRITDTNEAIRMMNMQVDTITGDLQMLASAAEEELIAMVDSVEPMIRGLIQEITDLLLWVGKLDPAIQRWVITFGAATAAAGPLVLAIRGLSTALRGMGGPMGIVLTAAAGVATLVSVFGQAKQSTTEFYQEAMDTSKELDSQAQRLRTLISEYERLTEKTDLSADESERLRKVMEDIAEIQPTLQSGYGDLRTAIEDNMDTLKDYIKVLEQQSDIEVQIAALQYLREQVTLETELIDKEREKAELMEKRGDQWERAIQLAQWEATVARGMLDLDQARAAGDEERVRQLEAQLAEVFREWNPDIGWAGELPAGKFYLTLSGEAEKAQNEVENTTKKINELDEGIKRINAELAMGAEALGEWQRRLQGIRPTIDDTDEVTGGSEIVQQTETKTVEVEHALQAYYDAIAATTVEGRDKVLAELQTLMDAMTSKNPFVAQQATTVAGQLLDFMQRQFESGGMDQAVNAAATFIARGYKTVEDAMAEFYEHLRQSEEGYLQEYEEFTLEAQLRWLEQLREEYAAYGRDVLDIEAEIARVLRDQRLSEEDLNRELEGRIRAYRLEAGLVTELELAEQELERARAIYSANRLTADPTQRRLYETELAEATLRYHKLVLQDWEQTLEARYRLGIISNQKMLEELTNAPQVPMLPTLEYPEALYEQRQEIISRLRQEALQDMATDLIDTISTDTIGGLLVAKQQIEEMRESIRQYGTDGSEAMRMLQRELDAVTEKLITAEWEEKEERLALQVNRMRMTWEDAPESTDALIQYIYALEQLMEHTDPAEYSDEWETFTRRIAALRQELYRLRAQSELTKWAETTFGLRAALGGEINLAEIDTSGFDQVREKLQELVDYYGTLEDRGTTAIEYLNEVMGRLAEEEEARIRHLASLSGDETGLMAYLSARKLQLVRQGQSMSEEVRAIEEEQHRLYTAVFQRTAEALQRRYEGEFERAQWGLMGQGERETWFRDWRKTVQTYLDEMKRGSGYGEMPGVVQYVQQLLDRVQNDQNRMRQDFEQGLVRWRQVMADTGLLTQQQVLRMAAEDIAKQIDPNRTLEELLNSVEARQAKAGSILAGPLYRDLIEAQAAYEKQVLTDMLAAYEYMADESAAARITALNEILEQVRAVYNIEGQLTSERIAEIVANTATEAELRRQLVTLDSDRRAALAQLRLEEMQAHGLTMQAILEEINLAARRMATERQRQGMTWAEITAHQETLDQLLARRSAVEEALEAEEALGKQGTAAAEIYRQELERIDQVFQSLGQEAQSAIDQIIADTDKMSMAQADAARGTLLAWVAVLDTVGIRWENMIDLVASLETAIDRVTQRENELRTRFGWKDLTGFEDWRLDRIGRYFYEAQQWSNQLAIELQDIIDDDVIRKLGDAETLMGQIHDEAAGWARQMTDVFLTLRDTPYAIQKSLALYREIGDELFGTGTIGSIGGLDITGRDLTNLFTGAIGLNIGTSMARNSFLSAMSGIAGMMEGIGVPGPWGTVMTIIGLIDQIFNPAPPSEVQQLMAQVEQLNKQLDEYGVGFDVPDVTKSGFWFWTEWHTEAAEQGVAIAQDLLRSMETTLQAMGDTIANAVLSGGSFDSVAEALGQQMRRILMQELQNAMQFEEQAKLIVGRMHEAVAGGYTEEEINSIREQWQRLMADLEAVWTEHAEVLDEIIPEGQLTVDHRVSGVQITRLSGPDRDLFIEMLRPISVLDRLPGILTGQTMELLQQIREATIVSLEAQTVIVQAAYIQAGDIYLSPAAGTDFETVLKGLAREAFNAAGAQA